MELKIWVEGIQRIVCGVTETTTCQDVVFALAHATGKIGRFTLIERWRNNERLLAPTDNPLKILMKWGEYSSDVQFILQRSEQQTTIPPSILNNLQNNTITTATNNSNNNNQLTKIHQAPQAQLQPIVPKSNLQPQTKMKVRDKSEEDNSYDKIKDTMIKKNGYCDNKEIGIVKGVQQQKSPSPPLIGAVPLPPVIQHDRNSSQTSSELNIINNNLNNNNNNPNIPEYAYVTKKRPANNNNNNNKNSNNNNNNSSSNNSCSEIEFNSADVRNSLDRKINLSNENLLDVVFNSRTNNLDTIKAPIGISANGALVPPPYRDPPPPRSSPLNYNLSNTSNNSNNHNNSSASNNSGSDASEFSDALLNNAHYKDLIQLIKYQREKISLQQADLTKFDAEIVFLENKERDQMQQLEAIAREINKTDQMFRQGSEQLQTLQYIEEENELVRQQEKTLKSEITLLRSKLANCETELLQCKNKIRMLLDEIQLEQRVLNRQYDSRQQIERHFLTEVEKIQIEIDQAVQQADSTNRTSENLKREVAIIENAIAEKKKQVEQLVNEMKEVNLKSLAVAPSEEIRHLLESSNRPGSTRRMIGSPRQLENAVPTSKNPHGVWV